MGIYYCCIVVLQRGTLFTRSPTNLCGNLWNAECSIFAQLCIVAHMAFIYEGFLPHGAPPATSNTISVPRVFSATVRVRATRGPRRPTGLPTWKSLWKLWPLRSICILQRHWTLLMLNLVTHLNALERAATSSKRSIPAKPWAGWYDRCRRPVRLVQAELHGSLER